MTNLAMRSAAGCSIHSWYYSIAHAGEPKMKISAGLRALLDAYSLTSGEQIFPTGANGMSSHYGAPAIDRTVMTAELKVEPSQSGPGWKVVIQLAPDRLQYISGFESEQAARDWIINQSQDWFCRLSAGL